jgi:hypothetical protein
LGNDSAVAAEKRTRSKLLGHQRPHGFKSPEFIVDAYTVTGGLAVGELHAWDALTPSSGSAFRAGWTIGAGIETVLAPNWTFKFEYLYMDLGSAHLFDIVPGIPETVSFRDNIFPPMYGPLQLNGPVCACRIREGRKSTRCRTSGNVGPGVVALYAEYPRTRLPVVPCRPANASTTHPE